jgi:glycosyltransferase involved in cell wall biosynthesis
MITLIVPTRNRAHTLHLVAPSYFQQEQVTEIIFVSDAGTDDTPAVIERLAAAWPRIRTRFVSNPSRLGASASRNVGVQMTTNDYVLFCDDDESLEPGYARICLEKLLRFNAGAVSGRRIYLEPGETPGAALERFGSGIRSTAPFRNLICEYVNAARFAGDIRLPLTNAIILTRTALLRRFPFDSAYARGNGYREESDYQMNLFVNGYDVYVTNDRHSFHLPMSQVITGGQRTNSWRRLYWSVRYTRYFFAKYYPAYAQRQGLTAPRWLALAAFAAFAIYRETLRRPLFAVAKAALRQRRRFAHAASVAR